MPVIIRINIIICLLFCLISVTGCYNKTVRHLASEVILIEPKSSSKNDVLTCLGEPDTWRMLANGNEEWLYIEKIQSDFQRTPLVGRFLDDEAVDSVRVVFVDDIVQSCAFKRFTRDEFDWLDDYSWQEQ